jgi:hypothetical protein
MKQKQVSRLLVLVGTLIFTLFGGGWLGIYFQEWQIRQVHWGQVHGCHIDAPIQKRNLDRCTINSGGKNPIYLIGDSNADQFSEAVIKYAQDANRELIIATISGCPFLPGYVNAPSGRWPKSKPVACQTYYEGTMKYLSTARLGDVILAYSDQYFREQGWQLGESKKNFTTNLDMHREFLSHGITKSIGKLKNFGHRIFFVYTIPQLNYSKVDGKYLEKFYDPSLCSNIKLLEFNCDRDLNKMAYLENQAPLKMLEHAILLKLEVSTLDLTSELEQNGHWTNRSRLRWIYRDGAHISVYESSKLAGTFGAFLKKK